ncbi:MAG: SBBP repeat-containing protein [Nanoarchaeota archaeon]|nr:SBBP repeat-containing protein [Nanoarchaeota archaeon]
MRPTKKAISPVIAVALLLVVAVVAVVFFSTWFDSFRSALFTKAESDTASGQSIGIVDLVGDELFFQAGTGTAVSNVKASGTDCEFSTGIFSGLHIFDLGSCLNASGNSVEVAVFTDKGIYSKKFFVKEQYQSHELMPVLLWNKSPDLSNNVWFYDLALDSEGNIYLAGGIDNGDSDFLVAKYDNNMEQLWNVTYDGGNYDDISSIALSPKGDIYVSGYSNNGANDDFITFKYDSSGNEIWNVTYDGGSDEYGNGVTVDSLGNVYITGGTNNGANDDFITFKYDSSGNEIWNVTYDSGNGEWGNEIVIDNLGNVYVVGASTTAITLLVKYDTNGNEIWNVTYDSGNDEWMTGIELDSSGNIYVAGYMDVGGIYPYLVLKYAQR